MPDPRGESDPSAARARAAGLARDGLILATPLIATHGQDLLPFVVAARLVRAGHPESAYLGAEAEHLYDVPPAFLEVAMQLSRLPAEAITAQVAPPPSLLPFLAVASLPYPAVLLGWSTAMAALCVLGLRVAERRVPDAGRGWWLGATLALTPVLMWTVLMGQSAPLLLAAAALLVAGGGRATGRLGAAALAAATIFKIVPVLIVPYLLVRRRAALAGWTLAGLAAAVGLGLLVSPPSLYPGFVDGLGALSRGVVVHPFNASIDAGLARWVTDAARVYTTPAPWITATALIARTGLVLVAALRAIRSPSEATSAAAAWTAVLAASPLLWLHYLVLLPVLSLPLVAATGWRRAAPVALALGASATLLVVDAPHAAGSLATAVWLLTAGLVLTQPDPTRGAGAR